MTHDQRRAAIMERVKEACSWITLSDEKLIEHVAPLMFACFIDMVPESELAALREEIKLLKSSESHLKNKLWSMAHGSLDDQIETMREQLAMERKVTHDGRPITEPGCIPVQTNFTHPSNEPEEPRCCAAARVFTTAEKCANDFFSMAPKYRTKERLRDRIVDFFIGVAK